MVQGFEKNLESTIWGLMKETGHIKNPAEVWNIKLSLALMLEKKMWSVVLVLAYDLARKIQ